VVVPPEVTPAEAAHLPVVITVPTAGINERTNFVLPKWLTAVLVGAPLIALFALGGAATGECGEATELTTDVITGQILDCDGSEFAGVGAGGGGGIDFIALGEDIYQGVEVTGVNCAACHAPNGQGNGPFPALTGVLTTFGSCADQIEWVQLGSQGLIAAGRDTYGDTGKTINGGMPGHSSLTAEQLAAVVSFERVRFGGGETDAILADCGLAEETPEDGGMGDATEGGGEALAPLTSRG
jgi:mono/diheme cytochrome c family protein